MPGAWRAVALLWFVACFNFMARLMITTMHESVVGSIPMTDAQFGLLTSVFLWVYGFLGPWAGFLSDRFSRSRVITVSMLAWSAVTWLTAYSRTFDELLAMRALMAVFEASYMPASLALISEYHRGTTRALATGVHISGAVLGGALAGLGGLLAERHTWHYAFSVVGAVGVGYGIILVVALRDAPREEERPSLDESSISVTGSTSEMRFGRAMLSLLGDRSFLLVFPYAILMGAVGPVIGSWMPTYVEEHYHIAQGAAGLAATGYPNMAGLMGLFIGGAWSDRWRRTNVRGYVYVTVIGVLAAVPGILLSAKGATFASAMAGLVIYGLCVEFTDSTQMPILCQIVDSRYRATAFGLLSFVQQITAGLAIYATGALRDIHVDTGAILDVAAGIQAVAGGLLLLVKPRKGA
jgi:sugar phosphate permease